MEKVILISAKAEEGKTTTAKYLKQQFEKSGKKVCIIPFATYIKEYLIKYRGWDGVTKNEAIRNELQFLGTDKIKKELKMPLFHAQRIAQDIQVLSDWFDIFIIDDWRFCDEGNYIKAVFPHNTTTIRVHRLGYNSSLTEEQKNHISETDLDDYQFDRNIFCMDGVNSLQHLYDETDRCFKGKWY